MQTRFFCQSCTMPIDNLSDRGTEKDGSASSEYCKYCYQRGTFTKPDLTMEEMQAYISANEKEMNLPANIVQKSLSLLPHLKRWNTQKVDSLIK